jgi:hypothetical protein
LKREARKIKNRISALVIVFLAAIIWARLASATAPQFVPDIDLIVYNATQDQPFYYQVNATDPGNDSFVFTSSAYTDYTHTTTWTVFFMNNMTGVINFTPRNRDVTWPEFHEVLITVIDNISKHNTVLIKFNVSNLNDPPNITYYVPAILNFSMYENDSRNFTFDYNASDPDIPYWDQVNGSWYINGAFHTSNHSWRFNPGFCDAGLYNISLAVSDIAGLTTYLQWNVTVIDWNRLPVFNWSTPLPNITWPEEVPLLNNITLDNYFWDPDDECGGNTAIYYASGNQSSQVVISISGEQGHNVSFYPQQYWFGEETINFTRFDGVNYTTSNNFVLVVTNVPHAPVIQGIPNQTLYAYAPYYLQVNATSPDLRQMNYTDNSSFFDIDLSTGVISFTPDGTNVGNYSILINVSDGRLSNITVFRMEIIGNTAPVIDPIATQYWSQEVPFSLTVRGVDADGDNISFRTNYSRLGAPASQNATAATFSFTPHQVDVGLNYITVYATDSHGATDSTVFLLNISRTDVAPAFTQNLSYVPIKINRTVQIQLNATDLNGDTLTFISNSSLSDFPHFSLTDSGLITISPDETELGNHSVNITVYDNSLMNLSTSLIVTFEVTYNRLPYIFPLGLINATEDRGFFLRINATDPDNDYLTFYTNSSFNFSEVGVFSFVPNKSMVGLHNISVNVSDNDGGVYNITFLLDIISVNHPPQFDPPLESYPAWQEIYEENLTLIYVNATDLEGDELNFSSSFLVGSSLFNITKLSSDRALINFTSGQYDEGNYSVNISVSDYEFTTSVVINFTVHHRNHAPVIEWVYPYGTPLSGFTILDWANKSSFPGAISSINASENTTLSFDQVSTDPDNDTLSYYWYLDGSLMASSSRWDYRLNFSSAGLHNITFVVGDGNLNDSFRWNLSVSDVIRPPVFGQRIESGYADFASGSWQNANVSVGGVVLGLNGSTYYRQGTYYSEVIEFGKHSIYSDISWIANVSENASVLLYTSSSNSLGSGWSEWSPQIRVNNGFNLTHINSSSRTYLRYRLNLTTNDLATTPEISQIVVNYVIENESQVENYYTIENSTSSYWIDLEDFFYDADGSALNFSLINSNPSIVRVWIESWNSYHVGIRSSGQGTAIVRFIAGDPYGNNVSSNNVTLTFTQDPSRGQSQTQQRSSGGSSSVRTIIQQVPIDVNKFINLNLIVPDALTTYQNSTIISPIRLVNQGDKPLEGITLTAWTNISNVKLEFTQKEFASLGVGEEKRTNLIITSPEFLGSYEITVEATVKNPEFKDSAKIILTTLEKGELNKTQLNTKITFTRDLLLANPECLELNEMLRDAQSEINKSNFKRANELIEETIRYCRYLLASKESMQEKPSLLQRIYDRIFGLTSKRQVLIYGSVIVGVFVLLTVSLLVERMAIGKRARLNRKKKL